VELRFKVFAKYYGNDQDCDWPDSTSGKTFASGSNPEPIKSPIRCQRLATVATLIVWALSLGVKPRRWELLTRDTRKGINLSENNEDLI